MTTPIRALGIAAALAAAVTGAACSAGAPAATHPAASPSIPPAATHPAASPSIPPAARPACQPGQLRLSIGPKISEATQQETLILVLRNTGAAACDLRGYPEIALRAGGAPLAFTYLRHGDLMLTGKPPVLVTLPPGGTAYAAINKNSCVIHTVQTATSIAVTPPAGGEPLVANLPDYPVMGYCGAGQPGSAVDITPIEPALADIYQAG